MFVYPLEGLLTITGTRRPCFNTRGLYSSPRSVYRTGTTPWTKPTGPEAQRNLKELRPVFSHKLNTAWKDLGPKVRDLLDSQGVGVGEVVGPVVLWIGVAPETLCGEDAHTSANGCLDLLKEFDITDVEVEYRESIYTRSASPNLLKSVSDSHPTVDVRSPLTPVLGLFIAAQATSHAEDTGGLYLAEGGDSKKVLLVTARHVLFPPNEGPNVNYPLTNTSAPRHDVLLLGTKAFENLVKSIKTRIGQEEAGGDQDDVEEATGELKKTQRLLDEANEAMKALEKFHDEVKKDWSQPSQRVLGHIIRSPPITLGTGSEGFTEDYAVVELDSSKIDKAFKGNPDDRLLKLEDIISKDLMLNPDMLDRDGEPCLLVIKNGNTTSVTIGRANGIFSYTSTEWAILPYDSKSGVFSAPGDSGSIIADSRGRIGGLLTGGAGKMESSDITYATPFFWLNPRIKENGFPNAHIYPVMA
ncbi:hypothetical protein BJY52DRAFT_1206074 [Lactarius psammicola]|nr:hypothetical protein BJY52DRAFT_1206074 [Lactarius psammicola]